MSSRKPICAANWKMHKTRPEAASFVDSFLPLAAELLDSVEIVICPPYTSLALTVERSATTTIRIAAQNMHFEDAGAFTGEVSAGMLVDLDVHGVVLGHSERRHMFGETDEALARKVPAAFAAGLEPILCVGETLDQRERGETEAVLRHQVEVDLADVPDGELGRLVIAYEPVWAIGTGRNATPEQATEAIAFIRSLVAGRDEAAGAAVRILYGGSVKPDNAAEVLASDEIDGALVGGASLDPDDFAAVAAACR
jgi:triosephosphate isomerase (TIM)